MNGSITNIKFLMSILGQIVIQIGTQFTYFYYFILNRIRICGNPNSKENLPNSVIIHLNLNSICSFTLHSNIFQSFLLLTPTLSTVRITMLTKPSFSTQA